MSETQSKGAEYKARREALGWERDDMLKAHHWTAYATTECIRDAEERPYVSSAEWLSAYAEETRRREVGAKLRERREGLGWGLVYAAEMMRKGVPAWEIADWGVRGLEEGNFGSTFDATAERYTAVLDEAEARRGVRDEARRVLADYRRVKRFDDLAVESRGFILTHMGPLVAAWDASGFETPEEKAAEDAILAALAKLAEEPEVAAELVITDEMRADARYALDSGRIWDFAYKHFGDKSQPPTHSPAYEALRARVQAIADSVPAADPDPMPKPPEGVTVERESERFVVVAPVEASRTRCVVPRDEQRAMWLGGQPVTRAFLRYAADLAEWASRQHTRTQEAAAGAERARLLDAVRVAEEAVRVALEARRAADAVFQEAIAAEGAAVRDLARARKAAGLG